LIAPPSPVRFLVIDTVSLVSLGREISESLRDQGHVVARFDCLTHPKRPLYGIHSAYAKTINRHEKSDSFYFLPRFTAKRLLSLIETEKPDIILVVGSLYKSFDPQALRRLADKHQTRLFLYDTDTCNLYDKRREFIFLLKNELPIYDEIYSFSETTTRFFRETLGLPATWLPFAAETIPIQKTAEKTVDALFVGNADLRRVFLLESIKDKVTIFGSRWERNYPLTSPELRTKITDRQVWGEELHRLLASAKIVLNITRTDFYGAETGVNLRIFEAVAAGCFLLTDHCDEIEALFQPGKEIETFRSSRELAEKVRYYLENEDERLAIARRGHERFLASHTWPVRIRQMLAHMNIDSLPC
jgi:spore maturation protein CgeB